MNVDFTETEMFVQNTKFNMEFPSGISIGTDMKHRGICTMRAFGWQPGPAAYAAKYDRNDPVASTLCAQYTCNWMLHVVFEFCVFPTGSAWPRCRGQRNLQVKLSTMYVINPFVCAQCSAMTLVALRIAVTCILIRSFVHRCSVTRMNFVHSPLHAND